MPRNDFIIKVIFFKFNEDELSKKLETQTIYKLFTLIFHQTVQDIVTDSAENEEER